MTRFVLRGLLLILLTLLSACTANIYKPYEPSTTVNKRNVPTSLLRQFQYDKQKIKLRSEPINIRQRYYRARHLRQRKTNVLGAHTLHRLSFPSVADNAQHNKQVTYKYYKSRRVGKKKLIIILPIYGSYLYPSDRITTGLRARHPDANIALLEAENWLLDFNGLSQARELAEFQRITQQMRERIITSVVDVRRFIDWAEQQDDIDSQRIALIGFSMSALVASLATLHEPRLHASVIVMGAAHPHEVLSVCPGRPAMARTAVLQQFGWPLATYREHMTRVFSSLDPVLYEGMVDASKVLMIDAHYDDCMPANTRNSLWQALGQPERISYKYPHKKAFLAMTPLGFNTMRNRIYRFLEAQLN